MRMLAIALFELAAALHFVFFVMESLLWNKPAIRRIFRTTAEEARTTKFLVFNQGFYNLFLALGVIAAMWLDPINADAAKALLIFSSSCMVLASLVLASGGKKRWVGALVQGLPPLIALIALGQPIH